MITVAETRLSEWNAVEQRYKMKRGLIEAGALGCQATVQGDIVIDVPPESQVHKQVVRKRAEVLDITLNPSTGFIMSRCEEPDMHKPSGDVERLMAALESQWQLKNVHADFTISADATDFAQRRMEGHLRGPSCAMTTAHPAIIHLGPAL